ncbi:spondin-2-like isoform X1 [Cydia splendana]|uniref:spondin-2-like isoform X1 n=1 Tax=Cydia splendana TaxID=1100963 RepID=UPI00300C387E
MCEYLRYVVYLSLWALVLTEKCNHKPILVPDDVEPLENNNLFTMTVQNMGKDVNNLFKPDQRYAITIKASDQNHTFSWFMITVEDPDVDESDYAFRRQQYDVGTMKTMDDDHSSQYSDKCANTVENIDNTGKMEVSVHWLSPSSSSPLPIASKVRIRAMVAENARAWYVGPNLDIVLTKDNERPLDMPQYDAKETCNLCSEARYEVIFEGQWSKLTHPQQFPTNMDKNAYSYMVGASHDYVFTLWEPDTLASAGLQEAAENADMNVLEKEIMSKVGYGPDSTRTLIRGRRNAHPNMFRPSHALFRTDRTHHLFSLVIGIQPSPDWFLGVHKYELCTDNGWLEYEKLPLYPWDAGTMDGVSYNSTKKKTNPQEKVGRVALGSFDRESPFYQLNLNDLKPFGHLKTRLLDVYPVKDCEADTTNEEEAENMEKGAQDEEMEEPQVSESREGCGFTEWQPWSPCSPEGDCGYGRQFRVRYKTTWNHNYRSHMNHGSDREEKCIVDPKQMDTEYHSCYVDCY